MPHLDVKLACNVHVVLLHARIAYPCAQLGGCTPGVLVVIVFPDEAHGQPNT